MCSCTLFETEKDKLDNIVGEYWEEWKAINKDTTCCVLDFDNIMPFEWDTLVYFYYINTKNNYINPELVEEYKRLYGPDYEEIYRKRNGYRNSQELEEYMSIHNLEELKIYNPERLHFLKNGKIIHSVNLFMASDWAKGVYFCTDNHFIKRGRKDAKFHLIKDYQFLVIRDMTEEFVPMRSYSF